MSSSNRADKISIAIPILFAALMIGSLIGIIGNSLLLNSSESGVNSDFSSSSQSKEFRIFKIVVSSILTAVFLGLAIFSLIEIFEPASYRARIFTPNLDDWMQNTYDNLESWELILILSNFIILPVGIASALIEGGEAYFIVSGVFIAIVYFSYSQRVGTRKAIKATLPNHREISLTDLSKLTSKDPKLIRKSLLHLISYENYPAFYNYSSGLVTYNGPSPTGRNFDDRVIEAETTVAASQAQTTSSVQSEPAKPCPYCGETPVVPHAAFCSDCGASLVAAK